MRGFADRIKARAAGQGWPVCGFADRIKARAAGQGWPVCGFTLVELLLVLVLVALLASIVVPMLTGSVDRAREATLKENLFVMRKAIDDYYADNGRYPPDLQVLASKRYLRGIPVDPFTDRPDSWVLVRAEDGGVAGGIMDVRSGSEVKSYDGKAYAEW